MTTQFPVVRPSQRIRNVSRAMKLSGDRGDYPTNADTLEEIAAAVAVNEEAQAQQAARIAELESYIDAHNAKVLRGEIVSERVTK